MIGWKTVIGTSFMTSLYVHEVWFVVSPRCFAIGPRASVPCFNWFLGSDTVIKDARLGWFNFPRTGFLSRYSLKFCNVIKSPEGKIRRARKMRRARSAIKKARVAAKYENKVTNEINTQASPVAASPGKTWRFEILVKMLPWLFHTLLVDDFVFLFVFYTYRWT